MSNATFPLIHAKQPESIRQALVRLGLWDDSETIQTVERAGEGNMNLVLRVITDRRRVILKQSRPWVEKYPQIAAPASRILAEIDFYQRAAQNDNVIGAMPTLLASCSEHHLMALEDLGAARDFTDLYQRRQVDEMPLSQATKWLVELHAIEIPPSQRDAVGDRALRELNHAHIFSIPFQSPSAIPLDPVCEGLEALAAPLRQDSQLKAATERLGRQYLATGMCLLHGDFYPGSWLCTEQGFRVIDPEFTFAGPIEFDLSVLAAHLVLMGGSSDAIESVCDAYVQAGGNEPDLDLTREFAGVEIIRRLIGVAQLQLEADLAERCRMIQLATDLVRD